jgi:hypothetical protein
MNSLMSNQSKGIKAKIHSVGIRVIIQEPEPRGSVIMLPEADGEL